MNAARTLASNLADSMFPPYLPEWQKAEFIDKLSKLIESAISDNDIDFFARVDDLLDSYI